MTVSSYTVIAIDNSGREHTLEQKGHHRRDAVHKLLSSEKGKEIVEVLNGNTKKDFRKSIWLRPGCHSRSPDPLPTESTSLGLALGEAISCQGREAARLILKDFENRGYKLGLFDEDGDEPTIVYPRGLTDQDKATIEENRDSLITVLRAQSTSSSNEKPKRKTQRDVLRRILADPELKTAFQRYDIELLLRRSGEHSLADDDAKLDALLAWAAQQGLIERTTRGNYRKVAVASDIVPPATKATTLTDEQPPQHTEPIVVVAAKEDIVEAATPLVPERITKVEALPPTAIAPMVSSLLPAAAPAQDALIRLVSELGAGQIDESTIAQAEKAINEVLSAWEAVTNAVGPIEALLKRARQINANKNQLLQTFTGMKSP